MFSFICAIVGFQKQYSQCEIESNLFISSILYFISLSDIIKYKKVYVYICVYIYIYIYIYVYNYFNNK